MALYETVASTINGKDDIKKQRRRNLQHLVLNYLQEEGYSDTAKTFLQEAKINTKYQVCDNIDLDIVLQDFCSYYLLKFNKQPLICKLSNESDANTQTSIDAKKKSKVKPKNIREGPKQDENTNSKDESLFIITPLLNQSQDGSIGDSRIVNKVMDVEEIKPFNNFVKNMSGEYREIAENIFQVTKLKYDNVDWSNISGLDNAKRHLREAAIYPLKYPDTFRGLLSPWSGILLFGPPGSGKTLLVKALVNEFSRTFFNISSSVIVSKWRGESEKYVKILFELARYYSPSIIFMDEFEALTSKRDSSNEHEASRRLKHELLIELDGLCRTNDNVLFLATTNLPWEVDPAVIRRFEKRIFVPLPEKESRQKMFKMFLECAQPHSIPTSMIDFQILAQKTEGYSGSDIKIICKEAAMVAVRKNIKNFESGEPFDKTSHIIEQSDLENSITRIKPTAKELMEKYKNWARAYGAE